MSQTTIGRLVATYVTMRAARLSSRSTCWNRTYSGIATAIGGRIRCEISQKAMSLFPGGPRRPAADRLGRIAKTAAAAANTSGGGPPRSIPTNAIAPLRMNSPINATFGGR